MTLEAVFDIIVERFQKYNVDFAIIGGLALRALGISRATEDIDFLVSQKDFPKVKKVMFSLGFDLLHESEDAANFMGKLKSLGRVDFLLAHRSYATAMLAKAKQIEIFKGSKRLKVLRVEDLIGLKVQSSSNDQERYHLDMHDIESLMRVYYQTLDIPAVREYFVLFKREKEFEAILERIKHAK